MTRPIVGIIGNFDLLNDEYPVHTSGVMNSEALTQASGCLPIVIPADPKLVSVEEVMELCDGFLFTGGRPNVHPSEYGHEETPAHGTFDRARDGLALPLIRALVEAGQPFLGICRGFQEVNVAMGGTLAPEIRDLPGRMNHRMPTEGTLEDRFSRRHKVTLTQGGAFANLFGAEKIETNTLHGQGICTAGPRVIVEGRAEDGTAEAIRIDGAPGFTLAVQWHPEFKAAQDPISKPLFEAFGEACRAYHAQKMGKARAA
ncbi:gamma-glutamyl-gamma-aminobutyrate hydrolase family protein [Albirhodobacter sp. R86504]|uniref:gamma-glutamyl-gamma-aminobutyrate hydrolase family protein n=1 Tax=Albirhodobacter sp. R86504 TaxID=3093848 RepID=UPI00366AC43F